MLNIYITNSKNLNLCNNYNYKLSIVFFGKLQLIKNLVDCRENSGL